MSGSRARFYALALALSAGLHVVAWLLLVRTSAPQRPRSPRVAEPVEIAIVREAHPTTPVTPPPAAVAAQPIPHGGAHPVHQQSQHVAALRPASAAPLPSTTPKPAEASSGPPAAGPEDFPVDAPKALVLDAPTRDFVKPGTDEKTRTGGETIVGEPVAEAPEVRAKRAQQAIDGWVEDDEAEQRVDDGLVDPYFAQIGKSIEGAFKDGEKHAKSSNGKGATAAMNFLSGWSQSAQRFASTGNPNAPNGKIQDMQQRYGLLPGSPGPDPAQGELTPHGPSAAGMASLMSFADGSSGGLVAVVELRQKRTGEIVELSLKHGSGDSKFDKWVLAEIPDGLAKVDPPPADGAGIHDKGLHTLWAFEGRISYMRKVSEANGKDDWWYAPIGTVLGAMAGHFDIGSSQVEYFDPRHPHFVVNAKLLRVY